MSQVYLDLDRTIYNQSLLDPIRTDYSPFGLSGYDMKIRVNSQLHEPTRASWCITSPHFFRAASLMA